MSTSNYISLAKSGDWEGLRAALENDKDTLARSGQLSSLLHKLAAYPGSWPVLEYLIEQGADVNYEAYGDSSVLGSAIAGGSRFGATTLLELRALLRAGGDVTRVAESGFPPLHWCIVQNRLEHARLLLAHGADAEQKTADGETAFDVARRYGNERAVEMLEAHRQLMD